MIIYRFWTTRTYYRDTLNDHIRIRGWEGWFLLGVLPLYIRQRASEEVR